jgi:hypothetical protein
MVTEQKHEMVFDGDGRPVLEKTAMRGYHISNPPTESLTTTPRMYQVWSSVLGQSLTTVLPNGNKFESNVYAGGAVIAINNANGVGWKTADPVTGTVGHVGGVSGTTVEEFEPLGQQLHNQDPEPPPEPLPTESAWNNADYPQWKCEERNARILWGNFSARPYECQKRYLQDMDIPPDEIADKVESPQHINDGTHSPLPSGYSPDSGPTYAANSMRSAALKSTAKDDDDTNCLPGRPCLPKEEVSFKIPLIDMSEIPGFVDASQSGGNSLQTTYTNKNTEIRKAIEDADTILSGDNECSKFFGKYGLPALAALDKLLERKVVDGPANTRTGIRMSSPENESPAVFSGEPRIDGNKSFQDPAYRLFHKGLVNSNGPFFYMLSPARIGNYNPASRESRVLQILHELAHMVFKPDGKGGFEPLIPNDGGSGGADSSTNTQTVLDKCKTEIENSGKKKK